MVTTLVLVCAATLPPAACTPATAIDVVRPLQLQGTLCGLGAPAALAGTAIRPEPGKSYVKTICTR